MAQSRPRAAIVRGATSDWNPTVRVGDEDIRPDDPAIEYFRQASRIMKSFGFSPSDPDIQRRIVQWGRQQHELGDRSTLQNRGRFKSVAPDNARSVVYYMRVGNRVKIGWTTNLTSRLANLAPEELLAIEQGGHSVEKQRHHQFKALHAAGEWFKLEAPLTTHIELLQQLTAHFKGSNLQ